MDTNDKMQAKALGLMGFRPKFPGWGRIAVFFTIIILFAWLDIYTKQLAFDYLANRGIWQKPVIDGFFNLVMRENTGAAWSSFQGQRVFLVSISVVAFVVLLIIFLTGQIKHRLTFVAASFFGAGILGNLYDRVFNNGGVRDFLDFYITFGGKERHWPAFNLADSLLCVAVAMLILSSIINSKSSK